MEENRPLVTVRVLTYNSSDYVLETLESVKAQTYPPIELIVSDDCSTDNTVAVCCEWIDKNKERFVRTEIITVPKNTGIAANVNRGFKAARGEWFKTVSGDDCLVPEAIEEYVRFVQKNHCDVCVADMIYMNECGKVVDAPSTGIYRTYLQHLDISQKEQMKHICEGLIFPGPPMFFSKRLIDKTGGCNEKYPFAEEWTFHFAITIHGYRVFPLNKQLVRYRIHEKSLSTGSKGRDKRVLMCMFRFYKEVIYSTLTRHGRPLTAWHLLINKYVDYKIADCKIVCLLYLLSPWWWGYRIKKLFLKNKQVGGYETFC